MEGLLIPLLLVVASVVFTAVLSFVASRYWYERRSRQDATNKLAENASKTDGRILELERQIAAMQANVLPISAAFQAVLVKQLTHFHTPVVDALLERLGPPMVLTDAEEEQLKEELVKRTADVDSMIDQSERDAAAMLPMVMARVRAEQGNLDGDMQVVIVPPAHE